MLDIFKNENIKKNEKYFLGYKKLFWITNFSGNFFYNLNFY